MISVQIEDLQDRGQVGQIPAAVELGQFVVLQQEGLFAADHAFGVHAAGHVLQAAVGHVEHRFGTLLGLKKIFELIVSFSGFHFFYRFMFVIYSVNGLKQDFS